jgi:hypothetical protein
MEKIKAQNTYQAAEINHFGKKNKVRIEIVLS